MNKIDAENPMIFGRRIGKQRFFQGYSFGINMEERKQIRRNYVRD